MSPGSPNLVSTRCHVLQRDGFNAYPHLHCTNIHALNWYNSDSNTNTSQYEEKTTRKHILNNNASYDMKKYTPLCQVKANENQELKGIFEFGISTLHICGPFTTCRTYMLFWWKKEKPRDLLSDPPLENTYLGSNGFLMASATSIFAQNIMVIPLTHKLGSLIHFALERKSTQECQLHTVTYVNLC